LLLDFLLFFLGQFLPLFAFVSDRQ
jgi:hypothetical protein